MQKYIQNSAIVIIVFYVIFAGLSVMGVVLEWSTWDEVGAWLTKGLAIASILFAINVVVALVTHLLPHSAQPAKKKK